MICQKMTHVLLASLYFDWLDCYRKTVTMSEVVASILNKRLFLS